MPPRGGHPGLRLPPGGTPWPLQASPHNSSSYRLVGGETLLSFVGVVMSSFKKIEKRKGVWLAEDWVRKEVGGRYSCQVLN